MKPVRFEYVAPTTVSEAVDRLAAAGIDGKALAGGQSLVPMMNFRLARPGVLVDLNGIRDLAGIQVTDEYVELGALVRHQSVADDRGLQRQFALLPKTAQLIGHWGIRTRGTVGGSVVHADPSAEWPAVLTALSGELELVGPTGSRWVKADEFILGPLTTAIGVDELLTRIRIPRLKEGQAAISEVARRPGDFALAGAVVVSTPETVRWTWFGLGGPPESVELPRDAVASQDAGHLKALLTQRAADLEVTGDMHGGAEWRRQVAVTVALRAWQQVAA